MENIGMNNRDNQAIQKTNYVKLASDLKAKIGNYELKNAANNEIANQAAEKILGQEGLNILHKGANENNPKSAREKFIDHLIEILKDTTNDLNNMSAIPA